MPLTSTRPNILFVFPDQWRACALGFRGEDPVRTPHVDAFAAQSRVLTDCISNYPLCSPYRAMLLTGQYPHSNGVLGNCNSRWPAHFLRAETRCFSDVLHDAGYECGYIGKWHLEHPHQPYLPSEPDGRPGGVIWDEWTPPQRRHSFNFWYSYGEYDAHFRPRYWTTYAARDQPHLVDDYSPHHEVDVAIDYLANRDGKMRDPDQPFALVVSMNPPHPPFEQVPDDYLRLYQEKTPDELLVRPNVADAEKDAGKSARARVKQYFAACTAVDAQFGRLLAALQAQGLEENTIVVFTSDHGEMMGSHNLMGKPFIYEEALNVPFLVRWPQRIAPGQDDLLLSTPDIMPTLLGLAGLGQHIPPSVEGRDFSALFTPQTLAPQTAAGPRPDSALYLRTPPEAPSQGQRGLRTHRHTLLIGKTPDGNTRLLFDNRNDPFQMHDLVSSEPALVEELTHTLHAWLQKTRDPWLAA